VFNEVNINTRQLHRVSGAVLVFTTSLTIEFVRDDLTTSIPLYSTGSLLPNEGITFSIAVDGYLSFEKGAQVKLLEVGPYESTQISAQSFFKVAPADPFQPIIYSWGVISYYKPAVARIFFKNADGSEGMALMQSKFGHDYSTEEYARILVDGAPWLGIEGYPEFKTPDLE
jgi:hypothetical protein